MRFIILDFLKQWDGREKFPANFNVNRVIDRISNLNATNIIKRVIEAQKRSKIKKRSGNSVWVTSVIM